MRAGLILIMRDPLLPPHVFPLCRGTTTRRAQRLLFNVIFCFIFLLTIQQVSYNAMRSRSTATMRALVVDVHLAVWSRLEVALVKVMHANEAVLPSRRICGARWMHSDPSPTREGRKRD